MVLGMLSKRGKASSREPSEAGGPPATPEKHGYEPPENVVQPLSATSSLDSASRSNAAQMNRKQSSASSRSVPASLVDELDPTKKRRKSVVLNVPMTSSPSSSPAVAQSPASIDIQPPTPDTSYPSETDLESLAPPLRNKASQLSLTDSEHSHRARQTSSSTLTPAHPRHRSRSLLSNHKQSTKRSASTTSSSGSVLQPSTSNMSVLTSPMGSPEEEEEDDGDRYGYLQSIDPLDDEDYGAVGRNAFDDGVLGYAVASSKRNADFHALFETVPEDDYLVEDFGCALQREILLQGRLYVSEHHLCFYANIFGWVTNLVLPLTEVVSVEKRMTAMIIPNAIQITTIGARHTFASFLARDTTYDLIVSIWRISHPSGPTPSLPDTEPSTAMLDSEDSHEEGEKDGSQPSRGRRRRAWKRRLRSDKSIPQSSSSTTQQGHPREASDPMPKKVAHRPTTVPPSVELFKDVMMDETFNATPEKIYNLMFTSEQFMRDFWANNQKLTEIQLGDWKSPTTAPTHLLMRDFSYIKPISAPVGPKQLKCYVSEFSEIVDFDAYVVVLTVTRTPDAPSGNSFSTKTRTCMTWAKNNQCRVQVFSTIEWTKSSFLKGVITSSALEGQRSYHVQLNKEMRAYIEKHKNEFHDPTSDPEDDQSDEEDQTANNTMVTSAAQPSTPEEPWLRTKLGPAAMVLDLLEPIKDTLMELSPLQMATAGVILLLIISNLWTLGSDRESSKNTPRRSAPEHRNPDQVASAVRDVLQEYFAAGPTAVTTKPVSRGEERDEIVKVLDELELRIARLRSELVQPID